MESQTIGRRIGIGSPRSSSDQYSQSVVLGPSAVDLPMGRWKWNIPGSRFNTTDSVLPGVELWNLHTEQVFLTNTPTSGLVQPFHLIGFRETEAFRDLLLVEMFMADYNKEGEINFLGKIKIRVIIHFWGGTLIKQYEQKTQASISSMW